MDYEKKALAYHSRLPKGKISIKTTKPLDTQDDLSLAYSPGVAGPCRKIAEEADRSFDYTIRGNLVAVITNGTAVLGLGSIGPYAAKPVMEGKGMLFKKFANIDVFDLEIDATDPDRFIDIVSSLEPSFGGINLEDIKAPECFYIEEKLIEKMNIPVFHDDQHGTAIITAAAMLNALEIAQKKIDKVKVVFSGAGAAAVSCAKLLLTLGLDKKNLYMCDSKGVITHERDNLNSYKKEFAQKSKAHSLEEIINGADVFIGVSTSDILTPKMLLSMRKDPIVFALANPNPEIDPCLAKETRSDVIIGTGRSDFPNQVNNVLGFPSIFRGALDVQAKTINEEMKLAAVHALAQLAKEDVPEEVLSIYNAPHDYSFGRDYLIPKPVDNRVLLRLAPAVAKAAMDSGVARVTLDLVSYQDEIEKILGPQRRIIRKLRREIAAKINQNQVKPHIALTSGTDIRMIKAAKQVAEEGEVQITLLGEENEIKKIADEHNIGRLEKIQIRDPEGDGSCKEFSEKLFALRNRKGISLSAAIQAVKRDDYFAAMMLETGCCDGIISGLTRSYKESVVPLLKVIKTQSEQCLAGIYMISVDAKLYFFADCTINIDPSAEILAEIAITAADTAKRYTDDPIRVAMLSYASFGSSTHESSRKVARAVEIVGNLRPEIELDGELQADVALNKELREKEFPFSNLQGNANVLIFPNLSAANISYKLLSNIGGAIPTGPILIGLEKPAHVLQRGASTQEIVDLIYICAHQSILN